MEYGSYITITDKIRIKKSVIMALRLFGYDNRVTIRKVSFQDLARREGIVATIHNWVPSPDAKKIKEKVNSMVGPFTVILDFNF